LDTLIRYLDGELSLKQRESIQSHMRGCNFCREGQSWFYEALTRSQEGTEHAAEPLRPDSGMLASILNGIHKWDAGRSDPGRWGDALKKRVAGAIGPFLGNSGTSKLLQPVAEDGRDLLSTIEPVLANFLGERAASQLVSHVVDAAIVRP
jgi:hypothetical protein